MKRIQILPLIIALLWIYGCKKEQGFYVAKTSFTIVNTQAYVDSLVQFTNTSDIDRVAYSWDFGDGVTSDLKDPSHTYTNHGQYTITLKTFVNKTLSNSASQNISVLIGEKYLSLKTITEGYNFAEGADSSIFVIGVTSGTDGAQVFLSKFDRNLRFSWVKYFNKNSYSVVGNIEKTADGNFLISGMFNDPANSNHFALTKIDQQGGIIWDTKYEQTNGECIFATEAKDGGIISIGSEETAYNSSVNVLKTDGNGNFEWQRNFATEGLMSAKNIIPLNDGYLFAASTNADNCVITKLNLNGEVVWKKSTGWQIYGATVYRVFSSTIAMNDKYLVVVNDGNYYVMVFDLEGNFIKRSYSEIEENTLIASTKKNKFVIGGRDDQKETTIVNFFTDILDRYDTRLYGKRNLNCQPTRGNGSALKSLSGGNLLFMGIRYKECMGTSVGSTLLVKIKENGDIQ